ncbi:MAG: hypothetical protein PGN13_06395 [Patulibacter minatonensis]
MDLNAIVSLVLFGSIPLVIVVRSRAKRADRKRDERERARRASGSDRSLY